jgi:hypothetical protein
MEITEELVRRQTAEVYAQRPEDTYKCSSLLAGSQEACETEDSWKQYSERDPRLLP